MKLLKRIISVFLAVSMMPIIAFATEKNITIKHNVSVYSFLSSLGIVDDTFSYGYNKPVTRMEFASAVAAAGGYNTNIVKPLGVFSDVSEDNEYVKDIEFLASMGAVSGYEGKFFPDRNITLEEALAIILRVAGYDDIALMNGGYPKGVMETARQEKLLENVSVGSGVISGDDMLVLLFNMLNLNTFTYSSMQSIEKDTSETILSQRHNVYYSRGIVTSNSITSLYSRSEVRFDGIILETENKAIEIEAGKTEIESMIGRHLTVYYKYDDNLDTSVCVYYEPTKKNEEIVVEFDSIEDLSFTRMQYITDSDKSKVLKFDNPAIIYNDAYYTGPFLDESSFSGMTGAITCVDNNGDGEYDVLLIDAYKSYVVKNAVAKELVFYDKITGEEVNVDPENTDFYEMKYANGGNAVFEDLVADMVVSVAKSVPDSKVKTLRVVLSDKKTNGVIENIIEEESTYIVINQVEMYKVLDGVTIPRVGTGATLFLDMFENVVYFETKYQAEFKFGFMVRKFYNEIDDVVSLKFVTREEKMVTLPIAKRAVIDGERLKNGKAVNDAIDAMPRLDVEEDISLPQGILPIRYKLNESNEIIMIDSPTMGRDEEKNSLDRIEEVYGTLVYSSDGHFGFQIPVNEQTTVMQVEIIDEEYEEYERYLDADYYFKGIDTFVGDNAYGRNVFFKLDPNSEYADVVFRVTTGGSSIDHNTSLVIVDKITTAYDAVTEEVLYRLNGMTEGKECKLFINKQFETDFLASNYQRGDALRISTDINGHICSIGNEVIRYNKGNDGKIKHSSLGSPENTTSRQSSFTTFGDVRSREEGLITFYYRGTDADITRSATDIESSNVYCSLISGSVPVTVVDLAEEKVYSGTYDNIIARKNNQEKYSSVLLRYRSSQLKEVVVYNIR